MLHLKSYVGSIVLAGLLLQGCGSSDTETTTVASAPASAAVIKAENTINAINEAFAGLDINSTQAEVDAATRNAKLLASQPSLSTQSAAQRAGLFSGITDKLKSGLTKVLDTSLGNKVTSAAFDVVLNSEGVTVVMLDLARKSHTTTKIMIDALDADWSLTKKMIPMLQTNKEFGEKFAALAWEEPEMARFFFSRVDAPMYNALADAMLLSNNDAIHDGSVEHSTNQYMAMLMNEYATEYFVAHNSGSKPYEIGNVKYPQNKADGSLATDDNFVNLLYATGEVVTFDGNVTFTGHGDGTELINEKFFYALFKTPDSTNGFIDAMDKIPGDRTALMDLIFLGEGDTNDTTQGYLNIISIGSSMYDGIYGVDIDGTRTGGYGFGAYSGAFIGFAGLIPSDRYITYGKAFMNAGYEYAKFHGVDVWATATDAAKTAWDAYTEPTVSQTANTTSSSAPSRSAGLGIVSSDWVDDVYDIMKETVYSLDYSTVLASVSDLSLTSVTTALTAQTQRAYGVFMYGLDENNASVQTSITNPATVVNDDVSGIHGLIELAVKENQFQIHCGSNATDNYVVGYECTNDINYTMADVNFTLPKFGDLTMSFAYNTATDGALAYMGTIDEAWFADLSTNELVRKYFYPTADNVYIPSWMLAIDWLTVPTNYTGSGIEDYDFQIDFNSGYLDVYVVSTNDALLTDINLTAAVSAIKTIEMVKVEMGTDSIIAVDEAGLNLNGLNVYKITVITAADAEKVLAYLGGLGNTALSAIGLDSTNASNVDTTEAP